MLSLLPASLRTPHPAEDDGFDSTEEEIASNGGRLDELDESLRLLKKRLDVIQHR